jgi:tRNA threonylcarbamoyladenosine biosynthesis protein TsaE
MKTFEIDGIENLSAAASWLLQHCRDKKIFAILGEMGSGKTSLISSICRLLDVKSAVSSPTFSIIHEYRNGRPVFHMDLYRVKNAEEALDAGVMECLSGTAYCFIEWPEILEAMLPSETQWVQLLVQPDQKRILQLYE